MRRLLRCWMAGVLVMALVFSLPALSAGTKVVDIHIKNGAVVGKKSVRVTRGDTVVLRWTSDTPLELHLHGYDLTVTISPGGTAQMTFDARATGRFPVEVHTQRSGSGHAHKALFHVEVYPE